MRLSYLGTYSIWFTQKGVRVLSPVTEVNRSVIVNLINLINRYESADQAFETEYLKQLKMSNSYIINSYEAGAIGPRTGITFNLHFA